MKFSSIVRVGWCDGSWDVHALGVRKMACAALTSTRVSLLYLFRAEHKLLTGAGTELWLLGLMAVVEALPGSRWRLGAPGSLQTQTWAAFMGSWCCCSSDEWNIEAEGMWGSSGKGRAASKSCSTQCPTEHCWEGVSGPCQVLKHLHGWEWRMEGCAAVSALLNLQHVLYTLCKLPADLLPTHSKLIGTSWEQVEE